MFQMLNSCKNPTRRNLFRLAAILTCTAKVITYITLLSDLRKLLEALDALKIQIIENNNFCYSPVLDDKLVSVVLHADTFGFNDTSVDREGLGNPRLKPVTRPVDWELAHLCEQNKYQLNVRTVLCLIGYNRPTLFIYLFITQAPTCFGTYVPSSGSVLYPCELLESPKWLCHRDVPSVR
jgi:hypothetical protein